MAGDEVLQVAAPQDSMWTHGHMSNFDLDMSSLSTSSLYSSYYTDNTRLYSPTDCFSRFRVRRMRLAEGVSP